MFSRTSDAPFEIRDAHTIQAKVSHHINSTVRAGGVGTLSHGFVWFPVSWVGHLLGTTISTHSGPIGALTIQDIQYLPLETHGRVCVAESTRSDLVENVLMYLLRLPDRHALLHCNNGLIPGSVGARAKRW